MIRNHRYHLILSMALLHLPGCFIPSRYLMRRNLFINQPYPTPVQGLCDSTMCPVTITIWIHGTRLFSRPFFHEYFNSTPGIVRADEIPKKYTIHKLTQTLINTDPIRFPHEHFYVFGWSGKLCFEEREVAAQSLATAIKELIDQYRDQHIDPLIRIIGHSHGGNVALNLAHTHSSFCIDELILLACPVQNKTKKCVRHPMFKKIYALYSALDIIQILDPQGMYKHKHKHKSCPFFSNRQFIHQDNLAQMKVKINRRAITHCEFAREAFLKLLPNILDGIDLWHHDIIYPEDPNNMCKLLCVYTDRQRKS